MQVALEAKEVAMELERRIQRIYSSVDASIDVDIAKLTPASVVDTANSYSAHYDFSGNLTDSDLLNIVYGIIHNIANFRAHAKKWLKDNGKNENSIEQVVDKSLSLKLAIDLSNYEKHPYPPRDGGRSGLAPTLTRVKRLLSMTGGSRVIFGPHQPPSVQGSGSAQLVIDARVLDKDGNTLGDFNKLMASAVTDLEQFLLEHSISVPDRKPPQFIHPQIPAPRPEMRRDNLEIAFHERIAPQTVLIHRSYRDENGEWCEDSATGVIIGHGEPQGSKYIKIATTGHLLTDSDDNFISWRVSRTSVGPKGNSSVRVVEFETDKPLLQSPGVPGVIRPHDIRQCDIGYFAIPNSAKTPDGSDAPFLETDLHKPLRLVPRKGQPLPGTRVAWAGFPSLVELRVGSHNLCHFEGILSCVANNPPLYLVDGHVSNGVSGGPLWICDTDGTPMVIGIVSNYTTSTASNVPGLAGFAPLQTLLNYLRDYSDSGIAWYPFCKCHEPDCAARRRKFPGSNVASRSARRE
jgi:hypothetical protein